MNFITMLAPSFPVGSAADSGDSELDVKETPLLEFAFFEILE